MTRLFLAATALGTLTGLALTFGTGGAVGVAVCAAAVIAWFAVRAVRRDTQRERDKARHPSAWGPLAPGDPFVEYRAADATPIWPRYEIGGPGQFDLKPWPIGDDEVRS